MKVDGKNVVVTGKIAGESRQTAQEKLRDAGAFVQSAVVGSTELLVTGANVGATKMRAAAAKGAIVVPWEQVSWNGDGDDGDDDGGGAAAPAAKVRQFGTDRTKTKGVRQIEPMLCKKALELPTGGDWLYEVKWDGVRCVATIEDGAVAMASRSAKSDWTERYPHIAEALSGLDNCIIDGEIVILDAAGASDFQALAGHANGGTARFIVFDVLSCPPQGDAVRRWPLRARKELLRQLLEKADTTWVAESPTDDDGEVLLAYAREHGLEGVVAKRAGSTYQDGGRGPDWLKIKIRCEQEFVVVGYTPGEGARAGMIGALVLAVNDGDDLILAGHAGTGFSNIENNRLLGLLRKQAGAVASVKLTEKERKETRRDGTIWVRPEVVVQVEFQRWTEDNRLWHPAYKGQRHDKAADDVVREPCAS